MKEAVASLFVMFSVCTCVQKAHSISHTTKVGQDVHIPCGINSMENVTRLVWKFGKSASNSEQLAFSFEGIVACDRSKKDCELRDNGDLVIRNVKEVDSNDTYFCFLNDEKYYAEHTLNILPRAPPPNFEKCPDAVSVSKPDHSSQRLVAYTTPICRNSEDFSGSVTCTPASGTKIDSSVKKVVCNCAYSEGHADTCEMTIPADRSKPVCAKIAGQGFAIGFGVCAIGGATVLFIWCYIRNKRSKGQTAGANGSPHSPSQNETTCPSQRANTTEGSTTVLPLSEISNRVIQSPTEENEANTQVPETTQEPEVTQEREQLIKPADRQTIETTQASGVQPDSAPVPAQANIQQEEITQDPGVQPKTEPLAIQENPRPKLSSTKVTSPPQFRNPESGYDTVDSPENAKAVTMEELMIDFDSGPQIKLLPLEDIHSDGMEIRSFSDNCFKVIRKSEEEQDVPLTCRKDGHHWDICYGDESCFYISCGYCRKGCLLVGISGGKPTHNGQQEIVQ